ncbi:MAG: transposase, partial [Candidatus Latescibacteria bacterium]|nr:transposase [Candidatus Latescibacterota bacterium]
RKGRLFVELLVEKPRPARKTEGRVIGMDSNYKNGLVFSDGQVIGQSLSPRIQTFQKRQKHTHDDVKSLIGHALKHMDWTIVRVLCIENLKYVKHRTRGTFSRSFNRRLSHWLYAYVTERLRQYCEVNGVRLERKSPYKTSQYCRLCNRWDRRNRVGDRFRCVHCGHTDHADHHAAKNLELLGVAGVYGLRSLPNVGRCSETYRSK